MPAELDSDESGVVYVRITVNKDGTWNDATIIRGINKELNSIAIDILQEMPHWIPASHKGENVISYVTISVTFE
ncbi:MAG: energy transducer TonB [Crocinitomicaceae bacterium]